MKVPTAKRPLRHLARFILLGIYIGTRAGAIASASPIPAVGRSFVDLERGPYYRRKQGSAKTMNANRRSQFRCACLQVCDVGTGSIRRQSTFEFNGKPVNSVKTAFKSAVRLAGLGPGISPHTLRHTAATWLMQKGADGRRSKVVQQPLDQGIPGVANCIASISKKLE